MRVSRLFFAFFFFVLGFGFYGVNEIRDALETGGSPRSGIEGLAIAAFFGLLIGFMIWREVRPRKVRARPDVDTFS